MTENLHEAIELFKNYKLDEAQGILEKIIENESENILANITLAKIYSRTQTYGKALNIYNKVLELDENNTDAITGLKLIKNILQLTNNYYYENPYTDDDLYDF